MTEHQKPIEVGYWNIRGLGAPLRMMVMYRGVPLDAQNYNCCENATGDGFDRSHWFNKKPELKEKNPLINLPYVIDGDLVVTQSTACMTYLGRKLGLLGKNELELTECEQLLAEIMDVRNPVVDYAYPPMKKPATEWFRQMTAPGRSLDKLNLWLEKKYGNSDVTNLFFVGEEASAPDFHIWEMLDQLRLMAAYFNCDDPLIQYHKLASFHHFFKNLPGNQRYLQSKLHQLPCNNPSAATFGGTPSGAPYEFGQTADWLNVSGIY